MKKKRIILHIPLAIFLVLLCFLAFDAFNVLIRQWIRLNEFWRFLILPVSGYFIWSARSKFSSIAFRTFLPAGIPFFLLGCAAYVMWKISFVDMFIEISFLCIVIGYVFSVFGYQAIKTLAFPLLYLLLATSIAEKVLASITGIMQLLSAQISSVTLSTLGFEVLRDGKFIRLPTIVLEVAKECSGIGQLTALLAFALPLSMFRHKSFFVRFCLVASAFPIALFVNSIRIILIGIWNYGQVQSALHGPYEILTMPIIYPLALILVVACSQLLLLLEQRQKKDIQNSAIITQENTTSRRSLVLPNAVCAGLLAIALCFPLCSKYSQATFATSLSSLAPSIGEYNGVTAYNSPVSFYFGTPDENLYRSYTGLQGNVVSLYIARFYNQNTTKRVSSFSSRLLEGETQQISFSLSNGTNVPATLVSSRFNGQDMVCLYWFVQNNTQVASINMLRKQLVKGFCKTGSMQNSCSMIMFWQPQNMQGLVNITTVASAFYSSLVPVTLNRK